jgi:hypothetical protein
MKFNCIIIIILVIFFKTGNVLSNSNIFDVNNIEINKTIKISNELLANKAIKKGFDELLNKILLKRDIERLRKLQFSDIKQLVSYYQVSNKIDNSNVEKINYNISFDKEKMHNLFYKNSISYSEIINKEIFILPILKKNNQIFIYNKNFFFENWNNIDKSELLEFILPLEKIEIIRNVNLNKNNLLNLELSNLFSEYPDKNLALVLIEHNNSKEEKIYLKTKILGKNILKNLNIKRLNLDETKFYEKIIMEVKKEIIHIVKSENLIDIRIPSFLKAELKINSKNSLVDLKFKLKTIDSIEKIYVQEFNNKKVILKIKYLGKLDKIIKQLENQKIILKLQGEQWSIKII